MSEWIRLRVKTSTSLLSYLSRNGRGKRCVLSQLLNGTTVSPPDSVFASGPILLHPGYSYVFLRPVRVTCTTAMFHCPSSSVDDRQRSFSSRPLFLALCPLVDRPCPMLMRSQRIFQRSSLRSSSRQRAFRRTRHRLPMRFSVPPRALIAS